jgi:hypothetical protein
MSRSGHEQPQAERLDFIDLTYRVDRGPGPLVLSNQGPGETVPVRSNHDS